jgi:hypothetical protein
MLERLNSPLLAASIQPKDAFFQLYQLFKRWKWRGKQPWEYLDSPSIVLSKNEGNATITRFLYLVARF